MGGGLLVRGLYNISIPVVSLVFDVGHEMLLLVYGWGVVLGNPPRANGQNGLRERYI